MRKKNIPIGGNGDTINDEVGSYVISAKGGTQQ